MQQVALIEKHNSSNECWNYLLKMKRVSELTVEQIISKYLGFEGEDFAYFLTSAKDPEFKDKVNLVFENFSSEKNLMLFIASNSPKISFLDNMAVKVSYDVGAQGCRMKILLDRRGINN